MATGIQATGAVPQDRCYHRSSQGGATGSYPAGKEALRMYNLRWRLFSYVPLTPEFSEGAPVETKCNSRQQETRGRIRSAQVDARVAPRRFLRRRSTYRSPAPFSTVRHRAASCQRCEPPTLNKHGSLRRLGLRTSPKHVPSAPDTWASSYTCWALSPPPQECARGRRSESIKIRSELFAVRTNGTAAGGALWRAGAPRGGGHDELLAATTRSEPEFSDNW